MGILCLNNNNKKKKTDKSKCVNHHEWQAGWFIHHRDRPHTLWSCHHTEKLKQTGKDTWCRKHKTRTHTLLTIHKHKFHPKPVYFPPLSLSVDLCLSVSLATTQSIPNRTQMQLSTQNVKRIFFSSTVNHRHCNPVPRLHPTQTVVFLLLAGKPQRLHTGSKQSGYISWQWGGGET